MSGGEREEEEEEEKMSRKFKAGVYIVPYNVIFFPIHIVIIRPKTFNATYTLPNLIFFPTYIKLNVEDIPSHFSFSTS